MYENTSVAPAEAGSGGFFEPIRTRFDCGYCSGRSEPSTLMPYIDAVICISTQDNPDRTRQAAEHFHQIGLCRDVVFYRPKRGRGRRHTSSFGRPRKLTDKARYRECIIFRCMRLAEMLVVILSPLHWLTMKRASRVT